MGNLIKIFLFLTLFNISFSEEEFYEEKPDYEVEAEEEVVTGKSLFFENSNLIRIEMRKDGDKKFEGARAETSEENKDTGKEKTDSSEEGESSNMEESEKQEENKR